MPLLPQQNMIDNLSSEKMKARIGQKQMMHSISASFTGEVDMGHEERVWKLAGTKLTFFNL